MNEKLLSLAAELKHRIRGQEQVITPVVGVLQRGELGLTPQGRSKGSFLFLGPTGVGKTKLALVFTELLLGKEYLHRFDMSEYQHADQIKNLIGDESGYEGRLGEVLAKWGKGTLLFDEMEKAHPKIMDVFLQMMDAARITVGRNKRHDLSNFYIVFTSNLAARDLMEVQNLPQSRLKNYVLEVLNDQLRPELVARINEKQVFNKLTYPVQREIAQLTLDEELLRLRLLGYDLKPEPEVLEFLVRHGIDKVYGARPLRDTVERFVQGAVVRALLEKRAASGCLGVGQLADELILMNEAVVID
ncbi:MAG: AAA family ATPase [Verrucomicrobiales bacterium]|jgi:ATP-dependent Clp protease ATP-binding subunit ClpB|nr:AAA family ATPase [Verrucomicrobiales bacterium]